MKIKQLIVGALYEYMHLKVLQNLTHHDSYDVFFYGRSMYLVRHYIVGTPVWLAKKKT
jgi:hypothetical protein